MLTFMRSGPHLEAMKAFPRIATGGTFGMEATTVPGWPEVQVLWKERAVEYGVKRRPV